MWTHSTPFPAARDKPLSKPKLQPGDPADPPRLTGGEPRKRIRETPHVRDQAIIVSQLKLGLRTGEGGNSKLEDVSLRSEELRERYPDLGTSKRVKDRPNSIRIPSRHERKGNQSKRPRVFPLDEEMRHVLLRYLLVRPVNDEGWPFLPERQHEKPEAQEGTKGVWRDSAFRDLTPGGDRDNGTNSRSHYGRHRFTANWEERGLKIELVQYVRGDEIGTNGGKDGSITTSTRTTRTWRQFTGTVSIDRFDGRDDPIALFFTYDRGVSAMPDLIDTYIENRWMVQPNHANNLDTAHGGNVMKWMDDAGAMSAMHFTGESCVTAHIDEINFKRPIPVGEIALVKSYVYKTGRTSVRVRTQVFRENPRKSEKELTTESYMVFVAIDEDREPTEVPELTVSSDRGEELREEALTDEPL